MTSSRIVAADIGGTHARFAIAELRAGERPELGPMHRYRTGEHEGLASTWRALRRDHGERLPTAAAFGVAGPIGGDIINFINNDWSIERGTLAAELGLERYSLLNDFGAVAHAVPALMEDELEPICGPAAALPEDGPITVMGPGTGFGVALILRRGGRTEIVETEASHIGFSPLTEDEQAIANALTARYGRASVERIVSGPALIDLYRHFGGGEWHVGDAGGLWSAALEERNPEAEQALDQLVKCFGSAAGDMALAHGSRAVVISGALARRIAHKLRSPLFKGRFIAKGRYRSWMERIPVLLATHPEPGLLGAALAFQREYGP